ncbi:Zinc import ATP-binding protein ZnuC [Pseudoruegeria aquimaris]|uniref:Zinc import ATP-binding protein ZnuC n=1 Tax=Pseudoruegeria aquimaris TaxID=393663 RepID=A0A1Y5R7C4_9RHOB|nr:ATP-binding cassette domain-containing protein [Pseudoruegeria aquimaris]SLN10884.1 Zinc import ATP-binding protein ZnuC [Pseudoruegeria aquimaris]
MHLACRNLSLSWSGRTNAALADISHSFSPGVTGLVGANGSGKSSLIALLSGAVTPSAGAVQRQGRVGLLRQRLDPSEPIASVFGVEPEPRALRGALLVVSHDNSFLQAIGIEREIRLQPSQSQGSANSTELPSGSRM